MTINCRGEILTLDKDRAIYWEEKKMLIISDVHLGKSAHFRKHGIQVPSNVGTTDLQRLDFLTSKYLPNLILITGDMFHHKMNSDVLNFGNWRKSHPKTRIILIKGNHDLLKMDDYAQLDIDVYEKELICGPFRFIHDQPTEFDEYYNITGHIHPGVTIYGKARQSLKFPCFYFGKTCAILPAFSLFTGLSKINPEEEDRFYAITPKEVLQVHLS